MHDPVKERLSFAWSRCNMAFGYEGARLNHEKACGGIAPSTRETRACEKCGREISKNNIARHRRACTAGEGEGGVRGDVRPAGQTRARVYRASWKPYYFLIFLSLSILAIFRLFYIGLQKF